MYELYSMFFDNGETCFLKKIAMDAFTAESLNYIDLTFTFK